MVRIDDVPALAYCNVEARRRLWNCPLRQRVFGTPWVLTAGDGLTHPDYIHSLGRHQLASTTAVIAQPGTAGHHQIELRQQLHIWDAYNYSKGGETSSNEAQKAAKVGYEAMRIGVAKPYFVLGSGGVSAWSGMR